MPNDYYNYNDDQVPLTKIGSQTLDDQFEAIEDGFDKLGDFPGSVDGSGYGGPDTGTSNTYIVNNGGSATLSDLGLAVFIPANTNTGASTFALNGGSALPLVRNNGDDTEAGDLTAGIPYLLIYDDANTRWVIVGATYQQTQEIYRPTITTDATTSRTIATADENSIIYFTSASAVTVTVPPNADDAIPIGAIVHLYQQGAGAVSVVAGSGVTLTYPSSLSTRTQYSSLSLIKKGADAWSVIGDAAAAA